MAFWISGIVFKMVPCLLLTLFVWLLTRILNEVKQNRMRLLKAARPSPIAPTNGYAAPNNEVSKTSSYPVKTDGNSEINYGHRASLPNNNFQAIRNSSLKY